MLERKILFDNRNTVDRCLLSKNFQNTKSQYTMSPDIYTLSSAIQQSEKI